MLYQISLIADFIINAFFHIWPYLLITIPISVAVNMTGAARYINKAFKAKPILSIILATLVGAFSPFCSCGVIPVIASLLLGGVPLAPVMSFWIASPSMDPEMFFLSAATIGWNLAVWRLASTLFLSLSAGFITHYLWKKGWLGDTYIKIGASAKTSTLPQLIKTGFNKARLYLTELRLSLKSKNNIPAFESDSGLPNLAYSPASNNCVCGGKGETVITTGKLGCCDDPKPTNVDSGNEIKCGCGEKEKSFLIRLYKEIIKSTIMVSKFMILAFFLEALIVLYIPQNLIIGIMGKGNFLSVFWAALIGVPVYTSNLSALPMVGGLLQQGMNPGAALAFLISGPITTIPAMAAVKGLTTKKVFYLYVSFAFFGALVFGYLLFTVQLFI